MDKTVYACPFCNTITTKWTYWPYLRRHLEETHKGDFFGRLVAERENTILKSVIRGKYECPYADRKDKNCEISCACCIANDVRNLALASLAEEGKRVEENTK